jgi:hypothetical protein
MSIEELKQQDNVTLEDVRRNAVEQYGLNGNENEITLVYNLLFNKDLPVVGVK